MLLQPDPSLAEVPGFTKEQLDTLARSVELRRQQLQRDIDAYIASKQDELRNYGQQVTTPPPPFPRFALTGALVHACRDHVEN